MVGGSAMQNGCSHGVRVRSGVADGGWWVDAYELDAVEDAEDRATKAQVMHPTTKHYA